MVCVTERRMRVKVKLLSVFAAHAREDAAGMTMVQDGATVRDLAVSLGLPVDLVRHRSRGAVCARRQHQIATRIRRRSPKLPRFCGVQHCLRSVLARVIDALVEALATESRIELRDFRVLDGASRAEPPKAVKKAACVGQPGVLGLRVDDSKRFDCRMVETLASSHSHHANIRCVRCEIEYPRRKLRPCMGDVEAKRSIRHTANQSPISGRTKST